MTELIPTRDGGTLRTVREARDYMLALPDGRGHQRPRELVEKLDGILLFAQRCLKEMNDRRQMQLLREVSGRRAAIGMARGGRLLN
jgi:hypothetical protein